MTIARRDLPFAPLCLPLLLAACHGGYDTPPYTYTPPPTLACSSPTPAEVVPDLSVQDNIPTDYDPTTSDSANPTPAQTTTIHFSMFLPARCPGDRFPLILQSHGYGGTRLKNTTGASLDPTVKHFDSINNLVKALPQYGYVVISVDERGHGTPVPDTAPHSARVIDPAAETQDMIAILDWAYDNPTVSFVAPEPGTGIAKDLRVGTIGYSYGGGFEMPLAILDQRIDTMVPNGTWNNLLYSLLPGDAVKLGFDSLLCLLAQPDPSNTVGGNVNNTPLVAMLCNQVGPNAPSPATIRTRVDLATAATQPTASPRMAKDAEELLNLFYSHGAKYFQIPTRDGASVIARDRPGRSEDDSGVATPLDRSTTVGAQVAAHVGHPSRQIPVLFLQGNRDVLFNITDAYFNYQFYKAAGGDVRLLTTEGGHMNPLAFQTQGSANCGGIVGVDSILGWLNQKLKGSDPTGAYAKIPAHVCISVADTPPGSDTTGQDNTSSPGAIPTNDLLAGVSLPDVPVGSLSGMGAIGASAATLTGTVAGGSGQTPVFQQVGADIAVAGAVLAGIPKIARVSVGPNGVPNPGVTPVAYVGVGIVRGSTTILVDDEVTPFAALAPATGASDCATPPTTDHCHTRGTSNAAGAVLLPGVGERLQVGDKVGLLFYENHVQYLPANNGGSGGLPNPYVATLTNVQLPILIACDGSNAAGCYPGSLLSLPPP